ncbi:MAG: metallophosphoesterase [Pseudomonadota bacterium]
MQLIQKLPAGPLDLIGDVHGEIDALVRLLKKLGYDSAGTHPEGRNLVFLGDLTDRGPDSPAVLSLVKRLVETTEARCIAGNHELNLMRDAQKHGNEWWTQPSATPRLPAKRIDPDERPEFLAFLKTLPLALERGDLRVVHASWNTPAIAEVRARRNDGFDVLGLYAEAEAHLDRYWHDGPGAEAIRAERTGLALKLTDRDHLPPMLPAQARKDVAYQMKNPVRTLTAGEEAPAAKPFWAGGRWRMVQRVKWWQDYDDSPPVIVGHYWRRYTSAPSVLADKYGPDLFHGTEPQHWMGKRRNVYCVDFSVGGRAEQRHAGQPESHCQLAALRVPEWQVVHDDGETWDIGEPGT